MNVVEKINLILKKANISKVNLAKYLGVSRQMVYNYLELEDISIEDEDYFKERMISDSYIEGQRAERVIFENTSLYML